MNFEDWQKNEVEDFIKDDPLWRMSVYRHALFIGDLGWYDATKLQQDRRTFNLSNQLHEALGSISANVAEGYSRGSNKERAHFYEYSLGSARESRDWYHKGRHVLGSKVTLHRMSLLVQVIRLLETMIPQQRGKALHEDPGEYRVNDDKTIDDLLNDVPMP